GGERLGLEPTEVGHRRRLTRRSGSAQCQDRPRTASSWLMTRSANPRVGFPVGTGTLIDSAITGACRSVSSLMGQTEYRLAVSRWAYPTWRSGTGWPGRLVRFGSQVRRRPP